MFNTSRQHYNAFPPLSEFELFLAGIDCKKKILASLYCILLSAVSVKDKAKDNWEHDLGIEIKEIQWCKIHKFNQCFSANMCIKEHRLKLLERAILR